MSFAYLATSSRGNTHNSRCKSRDLACDDRSQGHGHDQPEMMVDRQSPRINKTAVDPWNSKSPVPRQCGPTPPVACKCAHGTTSYLPYNELQYRRIVPTHRLSTSQVILASTFGRLGQVLHRRSLDSVIVELCASDFQLGCISR